jgi:hypothetical protein
LRNLLPNKEVTIAAPASYWYLKGFPIAKMAPLVDYIIYMTYDLHGQVWPLWISYAMRTWETAGANTKFFSSHSGILVISGHSLAARLAPVYERT